MSIFTPQQLKPEKETKIKILEAAENYNHCVHQHKTIKYKFTPLQKKYSLSVLAFKTPILLDNNAIKLKCIPQK